MKCRKDMDYHTRHCERSAAIHLRLFDFEENDSGMDWMGEAAKNFWTKWTKWTPPGKGRRWALDGVCPSGPSGPSGP
jgi:hypothetical protein